jgi:flagellar biosynthetic protein FliO
MECRIPQPESEKRPTGQSGARRSRRFFVRSAELLARVFRKPPGSTLGALINTALPRGVTCWQDLSKRFNGFSRSAETVETVSHARRTPNTPLKQGVNEKWWQGRFSRYEISGLGFRRLDDAEPVISLREPRLPNSKPVERRLTFRRIVWVAVLLPACSYAASSTNIFSTPLTAPSLSDAGPSLLRVLGALALVLGLFLGGAWLVRNGRFSAFGRSRSARLNVLETRSLGARQAIYVVAYGQERFLIGSTPAGINLLSHLAPASEAEVDVQAQPATNLSFAQALAQVLRGQKTTPGKTGGQP